jgi:hypothetical protein
MEQPNQQPIQEEIKNKPPVKTNWKCILIVAVFALLGGLSGYEPAAECGSILSTFRFVENKEKTSS